MRSIPKELLLSEIERIIIEATNNLDEEVVNCLIRQRKLETAPLARHILGEIMSRCAKIPAWRSFSLRLAMSSISIMI
jgi:5-carboxymethyl-2-hydroxymuconate isomerase